MIESEKKSTAVWDRPIQATAQEISGSQKPVPQETVEAENTKREVAAAMCAQR